MDILPIRAWHVFRDLGEARIADRLWELWYYQGQIDTGRNRVFMVF